MRKSFAILVVKLVNVESLHENNYIHKFTYFTLLFILSTLIFDSDLSLIR